MPWLDTVIMIVIIVIGLFVMYRALKEPMDALGRGIKRAAGGIRNMFSGAKDAGYETISYG